MEPVGILALQGDFGAHQKALASLGAASVQVRTAAELARVAGLILPGGESTTVLKLLQEGGLWEPLLAFGRSRPIFGTCAGAILLAREVSHPAQVSLGLVDLAIERNAYGRQLQSRVDHVVPEPAWGDSRPLEAVFIRAPVIRRVGEGVTVLARYQGGPVLVEQGRHLVATFHPELSDDPRIHSRFLDKVHSCAG